MPELPDVEAVCRKLRRDAAGARIRKARLLRWPNRRLERLVAGRSIVEVRRRGKNLLLDLEGGGALRVHLRMTGNLYVIPEIRLRAATVRAYFLLDDGRALVLDDPRALASIELLNERDLRSLDRELGPEPLTGEFTLDGFFADTRRSRLAAKIFLMDQRHLAGLGNIYAAEALHRARIHPAKPMNQLSRRKVVALRESIVEILTDAVQSACNAYAGPGQFEAGETLALAVYGREGEACPACGRPVRRIPQGGRSTYFCPRCQRP